eukprot:COSAG01_NODE_2093_length_8443_cov_351.385307_2_plen_284_part_00
MAAMDADGGGDVSLGEFTRWFRGMGGGGGGGTPGWAAALLRCAQCAEYGEGFSCGGWARGVYAPVQAEEVAAQPPHASCSSARLRGLSRGGGDTGDTIHHGRARHHPPSGGGREWRRTPPERGHAALPAYRRTTTAALRGGWGSRFVSSDAGGGGLSFCQAARRPTKTRSALREARKQAGSATGSNFRPWWQVSLHSLKSTDASVDNRRNDHFYSSMATLASASQESIDGNMNSPVKSSQSLPLVWAHETATTRPHIRRKKLAHTQRSALSFERTRPVWFGTG